MELPARHPDLFAQPFLAEARVAAAPRGPAVAGSGALASAPVAQPLARNEDRAAASMPVSLPVSLSLPLFVSVPAPLPVFAPQPQPPVNPRTQPPARSGHPAPETLHPALWRAHQVGRPAQAVCASGFAELDRQLPGGGWPAGALTELLLPHPGVGELRLLAPVLAALQNQQRCVMWFNPPAAPCPWALGALGLDLQQQVVVRAQGCGAQLRSRQPAADILWALEQGLKSGQLGAVLAWLPQRLPADALRRLQLAAQLHEGPVFLLRAAEERSRASAAPLRLLLSAWGPDLLRVAITKRRGPPLVAPLMLELPPVLSASALARAQRGPARGAVVEDGHGDGHGRGDGPEAGWPDADGAHRPTPIGPRPLAL